MRKNYTPEYKAKLVLELLREERTMSELASLHGVHVNQLSKWRKTALEGLPGLFADKQRRDKAQSEHEELTKDLYAQIGELTTKLGWLKKKSGINV